MERDDDDAAAAEVGALMASDCFASSVCSCCCILVGWEGNNGDRCGTGLVSEGGNCTHRGNVSVDHAQTMVCECVRWWKPSARAEMVDKRLRVSLLLLNTDSRH